MANRTPLTDRDIQYIAQSYGIVVESATLIQGGSANSSYLLKTSRGLLVATINETSSWESVSRLAKVLVFLAEHGLNTTRPVASLKGEFALRLGKKPVMLKTYLPGRVPDSMSRRKLNLIGTEMARLHGLPPPAFLPPEPSIGRTAFSAVIESGLNPEFEAWLARIARNLEEDIPVGLPTSLIHADLFPDNTLFSAETLVALIDFEGASLYFCVFDVGMAIVGLCAEGGAVVLENARWFLEGYQSLRPLDAAERNALQLFVVYAAAATAFWRFREYNMVLPGHERSEKYREMVRLADGISQMPPTEFLNSVL